MSQIRITELENQIKAKHLEETNFFQQIVIIESYRKQNFIDISTLEAQLEDEKKKFADKDEYKTIEELCDKLPNSYQQDILKRIITDREYSKIYLSGYEENTNRTGKNKNLVGTVNVLGTFNTKKQMREEYEIKLYSGDPKAMFWCSCADHKFNSAKKNIMCKHISFLICKVAKILKVSVFENKRMNDEDFQLLLLKFNNVWTDTTITKTSGKITMESFKNFTKTIDDCCPICFNDFEDTPHEKELLLSCPVCKNYIHTECADIWLEQKETCAMCRSDIWEKYKVIKNCNKVIVV